MNSPHQHLIERVLVAPEKHVGNKYYQDPRWRRLIPITETSLNRILTYHQEKGYIIISAYRSAAAEGTEPEAQKALNYKHDAELRRALRDRHHLSFIPVFGGTTEKTEDGKSTVDVAEPSYLVTFREPGQGTSEELKNIGVELANQFKQDSVLWKEPGVGQAHFIGKAGEVQTSFSGVKVNDASKEYFTKLFKDVWGAKRDLPPDQRKTDRRFTYESLFRLAKPSDMQEAVGRYGEHPFYSDTFFEKAGTMNGSTPPASIHQHILERYKDDRIDSLPIMEKAGMFRRGELPEKYLMELAWFETANGCNIDLRWEMAPEAQKDELMATWVGAHRHDNLYMDLGDKKFRFGLHSSVTQVSEIPEGGVVLPPNFVSLPLIISPEAVLYAGKDGLKNAYEKEAYEPMAATQDIKDALTKATAPKITG